MVDLMVFLKVEMLAFLLVVKLVEKKGILMVVLTVDKLVDM